MAAVAGSSMAAVTDSAAGSASGASSSSSKKVTLITGDDVTVEVDEAIAVQSQTIRNMMTEDCDEEIYPIKNVKKPILKYVLEYCEKHVDEQLKSEADLKEWDTNFVNSFDINLLYHVMLAANFLEVKGLLDLVIGRVVDMIKGRSPEAIRKIFNIKNDFTPEQEAKIRAENPWAFEIPVIDYEREREILGDEACGGKFKAKAKAVVEEDTSAASSSGTKGVEDDGVDDLNDKVKELQLDPSASSSSAPPEEQQEESA